jgi:hypothetical protein
VDRLATFIIEKNAHVKNHYETILKWHEEDSKVSSKPKKPVKQQRRLGNFDIDEVTKRALEKTYGTPINEEETENATKV